MKSMTESPNAKLQKGAVLLPDVLTKETGTYVKMEFDARGEYFGLTWLRVKDGMGGRGDREDWVADIPGVSISVHDYHWNGEDFGANHGSFIGAIKAEMQLAFRYATGTEKELLAKIKEVRSGIALIRASIAKADVAPSVPARTENSPASE